MSGENRSHYFIQNQSLNRISSDFFANHSCIETAKALLGQVLCRRLSPKGPILKGKIVETESYTGAEDEACNTFNGRRTEANEPLFMSAGTCYVYMTYGMYYCFNISSQGLGAGVLLRALEPLEGIDCMQELRAKARKRVDQSNSKPLMLKMLSNGPSKLCMALGINKNNTNTVDITNSDEIWLETGSHVSETDIVSTKRVGISRAGLWADKPFRFYIKDSEFVSQK